MKKKIRGCSTFQIESFENVKGIIDSSMQPFYPPLLVEFDGYHFFCECFRANSGNWYTWFYMLGAQNESQKYIFTVKLIHPNKIEELAYTGYCTSLQDEKDRTITLSQALKFDDSIVNHFCADNDSVAYAFQIRRNPLAEQSSQRLIEK